MKYTQNTQNKVDRVQGCPKKYSVNIPEISLKYRNGDVKRVTIVSSRTAADLLFQMYDSDTIEIQESFIVLYFNQANDTIGWYKCSQGGLSSTVIDVRLIVATALKCGATALMLSHNHPSGIMKPSCQDINATKKIKKGCEYFDITVLDHVIVGSRGQYFSFADDGLL